MTRCGLFQKNQRVYYCLDFGKITQASNGGAGRGSRSGTRNPGTSGHHLGAPAALPNTDGGALDGVLTAKGASVLGVLANLNLFDLLAGGAAVAGAVLADDSYLLGAFGLHEKVNEIRMDGFDEDG